MAPEPPQRRGREPAPPPGASLARRLLERFSRDGTPLFGDLIEVYEGRTSRDGRTAASLWFWREVLVACVYGCADVWTERGFLRDVSSLGVSTATFRALRRRPGYSVTVVVLMAVAAGSVSGLAGIAHSMGAPLPPELKTVRVLVGTDSERGWPSAYVSPPELEDLRQGVSDLDSIGIFRPNATVGLDLGTGARAVNVIFADATYFDIMRARTTLGRVFSAPEGRSEAGPYVILSHRLWTETFGAAPDVVGTSVRVAGRAFGVLGVMDEGFRDAANGAPTDLWLPLGEVPAFFGPGALTSRPARWVRGVVRMDADREAAIGEEVDRVAAQLRGLYPNAHRGRGFAFRDLRSWWYGSVRRPARIVFAGGLWLLVLVLGNLAALFRMRGQERAGEMSLRLALGARRSSLVNVVLGEALVLAAAASVLGVAVAELLVHGGGMRVVLGLPYFATPRVDITAVVACAALIVPLSLLLGFGDPAVKIGAKLHPAPWLLSAEAVLAAALLTITGALVQDARAVANMPTGYEPAGLLTARLDLTVATTDPGAVSGAASERAAFAERFVAEASAIRGIESAALVGPSVLGNAQAHLAFVPEGLDPAAYVGRWLAQSIQITPGGLETLGVSILSGRSLEWGDRNPSTPVAVIDERIAKRFWPSGNAVGSRFCPSTPCGTPITVVGIAEAAKHRGREWPDEGIVGDVYLSYALFPSTSVTIALRADGTSAGLARETRTLIARMTPTAVLSDVRWMDDRLRDDELVQRMMAFLGSAYAAIAALLALVGTYGLVAVRLGRTWRDTAVRMALGARWAALARRLVLEGVLPVAAGVAAGAGLGAAFSPWLSAQVSNVAGIGMWGWGDTITVSSVLVAAAAAAATAPALKLGVLRPMEVLRAE